MSSDAADEIHREQEYVTDLYRRLDNLREQAEHRLSQALLQTGGTQQERSQRESTVALYTEQRASLGAVESGLCFGRLDLVEEGARYIGRIGIFDETAEYEPLLVDWRAPASRPFYLATAASPQGVRRRRHIRTAERTVTALDDEVLDLADAAAAAPHHEGLTSEAALFAAMDAGRTGRMRDIVETIQAEQDHIIRADLGGIMVVQGGPGTGKTAVALHRAAYLLYTYRKELSTRAVLVVGPNTTFLKYISQVLPSLAETGVVLRTVGGLFPGVTATGVEPDETAEVKGRAVMAEVLAAAVRDRQQVPDDTVEVEFDSEPLVLDRAACEAAREVARRSGKPHNLARPLFDVEMIHALSMQLADRIGTDPYADDPLGGGDAPGDPQLLDEADLAELRRELQADPNVQTVLDWLWPVLTPQRLLSDLYASEARIAAAAAMLTDAEQALLRRSRDAGWTAADAPLLDEAAELLGEDDRDAEELAERRRRQRLAYAEGALEILHGSRSIDLEDELDPEILTAADVLGALELGERQEDERRLTAAERAAADRRWAFGHVIVDEAQELSPMAWRLLMRRCPSRSMTIVGDVAQTGDPAGTSSWDAVLHPYVADRWRQRQLTVNYRTPAEIMDLAGQVLKSIDPMLEPPRSVRHTGQAPQLTEVGPAELAARLAEQVRREVAALGDGTLGVLVPAGRIDELGAVVTAALPQARVGELTELTDPVVVLTVRQAKGLEFDAVVIADPGGIVAESPRGHSDLYVAITRPTQRLTVLHHGDLDL
ncbi:HelD family protein [Catellatospora citrea]|uniref:DNA helicase n=1 Tax=Catellatospora citrea TaxID=53366 RepID=A0A8J3NXK0_9ACTN|nr:AAA family ATPase [Catellatospora citrea]RKE12367.1 DNA helicase IV [Catellatospora citrea]GIF96402.1 DNA helicase [Catellatospora citrea]